MQHSPHSLRVIHPSLWLRPIKGFSSLKLHITRASGKTCKPHDLHLNNLLSKSWGHLRFEAYSLRGASGSAQYLCRYDSEMSLLNSVPGPLQWGPSRPMDSPYLSPKVLSLAGTLKSCPTHPNSIRLHTKHKSNNYDCSKLWSAKRRLVTACISDNDMLTKCLLAYFDAACKYQDTELLKWVVHNTLTTHKIILVGTRRGKKCTDALRTGQKFCLSKLNSERNHRSGSPNLRLWFSHLLHCLLQLLTSWIFVPVSQISISHHSFSCKSVVFPWTHVQITHINQWIKEWDQEYSLIIKDRFRDKSLKDTGIKSIRKKKPIDVVIRATPPLRLVKTEMFLCGEFKKNNFIGVLLPLITIFFYIEWFLAHDNNAAWLMQKISEIIFFKNLQQILNCLSVKYVTYRIIES